MDIIGSLAISALVYFGLRWIMNKASYIRDDQ